MSANAEAGDRRRVFKYLGAILLGLWGWPIVGRRNAAEAEVFAGLLAQNPPRAQIPPGYYDPEAQLYFDAQTRKPMFVAQARAEEKRLSDKEWFESTKGDGFISLDELKKRQADLIKVRGRFTSCTLTSYVTTSCCPLFTDTRSDTINDD